MLHGSRLRLKDCRERGLIVAVNFERINSSEDSCSAQSIFASIRVGLVSAPEYFALFETGKLQPSASGRSCKLEEGWSQVRSGAERSGS